MEIIRGKIPMAQKVLIYGPEGIGKSTLAAAFPEPLFIDTEGSTTHMDVARLPAPSSFPMLMEQLNWVAHEKPAGVKTLVIDTGDWAERLARENVLEVQQLKSIEAPGYGRGYTYVWETFGQVISACDRIIRSGINVVITAHAALRKFEQPDEAGAYDRWELKMQNSAKANICAMLKEWADMVLFCNYETTVYKTSKKDGEKAKASGGARVMYTSHHPCWDAKNRHGLPEKVPMTYESIRAAIEQNQPQKSEPAQVKQTTPPKQEKATESHTEPQSAEDELPFEIVDTEPEPNLPRALLDLMAVNNVSVQEIKAAVVRRGYFPETAEPENYPQDFIQGCLIGAWPQVFEIIKDIREGR